MKKTTKVGIISTVLFSSLLGSNISKMNVANASVSMDEKTYNFEMFQPNMTDNQHLTYSIRGISKSDDRYQSVVDGLKQWNRSSYIEFTKEIAPKDAKFNNHVFVDFVDKSYSIHPDWKGMVTCGNHIHFFKDTKSLDKVMMQKLTTHETGHVLGYLDEPVDHLLMSHMVDRNVDFIKKYFDGLYFRYNTDKGKKMFTMTEQQRPQMDKCYKDAVNGVDTSQSATWWH